MKRLSLNFVNDLIYLECVKRLAASGLLLIRTCYASHLL